MKVLIFGATGMVGQGVLRECLLDPNIDVVQSLGRTASEVEHPKFINIVHRDLFDLSRLHHCLRGFDACFFCLGVSSAGMPEADYERLTYGLTMAAAETLLRLNPGMTFIYVSGAGTDSSEKGRTMWARVRGRTENALSRIGFKAAYMFRPAVIQSMHGERSKTAAYRRAYTFTRPVFPLVRLLFPNYFLTTEQIGRAMINIAKHGASKKILEVRDIKQYARASSVQHAPS